mgnify:CR=1 FL=1
MKSLHTTTKTLPRKYQVITGCAIVLAVFVVITPLAIEQLTSFMPGRGWFYLSFFTCLLSALFICIALVPQLVFPSRKPNGSHDKI